MRYWIKFIYDIRKKDNHDISELVVYGDKYVIESVEKANEVVLSDGVIPTRNFFFFFFYGYKSCTIK